MSCTAKLLDLKNHFDFNGKVTGNLHANRATSMAAGFTEDLLDQLNAQVYRQQQQIDALIQELRQMRERLPESGGGAEVRNLRDEIPPHY